MPEPVTAVTRMRPSLRVATVSDGLPFEFEAIAANATGRDALCMTEARTPVVSDPIAVDVINDPLRSRIYQQVLVPKSATELAAIFGLRAGRLYYHLKLLERHGWIRVVDEREAGTSVERVYGHVHPGGGFVLADSIFEEPGYNQDGWQIGAQQELFGPFQSNLDDLLEHGYPAGSARAAVQRFRRVPKKRLDELLGKIKELIDDCFEPLGDCVEGSGDPDVPLHGLLVLCEPFVNLPSHLGKEGWDPSATTTPTR